MPPGTDDPNKLGPFSNTELSLLIVAISIAIVMVTYSAAIIIGMTSPGTEIKIVGSIDLSKFETTVFTIVGAGIFMLGITAAPRIAKALKD